MLRPHLLLSALLLAASLHNVVAASAKINVVDAQMILKESDDATSQTVKLTFNSKSSEVVELDHTQKLKIVFKVLDASRSAIRPEQAFVRLTSANGKSAYFAAGQVKANDGLEVVITSDGIEKQLGTQGGSFAATLIFGAASPAIAHEWTFADISVEHRPLPDGTQPLASPTAMEKASQSKPEIQHIFRPPVKPAPAVISLAFTGIVFIPLVAFLLGMQKLGVVPELTSGGMYGLGFHAGLAGILGLYLLFWLRLNLLQTLPVLAVLEATTLLLGLKAANKAAAGASVGADRPKKE